MSFGEKIKVNHCECGCNDHLTEGDRIVQIRQGTICSPKPTEMTPVEWDADTIYREECWERLHPTDYTDCAASGRFCRRQGCAIWDKTEHRCSLVSIAINTKKI